MQCPKCKHTNQDKANFCIKCGCELSPHSDEAPTKSSVAEEIDKIQRYIPKGLAKKILSQKGKIGGERKQVTVMFCDMVDFTPMVERLGPDKAYGMMDQIYEILIHKVHEFEGTVNEMTGDGIMALFGAPVALEDAPQRAIRSALAINNEISTFNELNDVSPPIMMRTGIHTGSVVVGTLGNDLRVEFKAVGDTVNLASRMEGLAEPDSVYVTEETYELTKELFKFEDLGNKSIKGKIDSVNVYKAVSAKKDVYRPRLGEERMIFSEMVGRDKELNKLELQVMKAINGEGSVVNIIGEAGIGKSRLIAELKNLEVIKKIILLEGKAISIGENLSFYPIIDLIKQWASIKENDNESAAFNKLELAVQGVDIENSNEIIPFVATLMAMKLSGKYAERIKGIEGEALEKLIFKNVRDLLIKASESFPIVVIIEDLHWADQSSIDLLSSLYRLSAKSRILFINVFRPGYSETGDKVVRLLEVDSSVFLAKIELESLDVILSEKLIYNMLKISGLTYNIIKIIVKRSDGNPFFIEEVVRSFIDTGAVLLKDGKYEVTDQINNINIPHSINEVLMARIDRLEESERSLVKIASVIGRNFFYRVLHRVANNIDNIESKLSYLKEIQLIRERSRMDEIEYLFKHALAQEAVYESILATNRGALHLKIASAIERIFQERLHEFYGILSYHCIKGDDLDKAEVYLIKAGEEALKTSASREAIHYYKEALKLFLNKYGKFADVEKRIMIEKKI
ncbi:MAG: adenylate/guanylate cyclase domain-containing protein, partial [Candidatus Hodarchaeales archaeon]